MKIPVPANHMSSGATRLADETQEGMYELSSPFIPLKDTAHSRKGDVGEIMGECEDDERTQE